MLKQEQREEMIAWLMLNRGCSKGYWDKQSDAFLQEHYKDCCIMEREDA